MPKPSPAHNSPRVVTDFAPTLPAASSGAVHLLAKDFVPRYYQVDDMILPLQQGKKNIACVWHRRAGKDISALHATAMQMYLHAGNYWHVFPEYNQGRKAIWDGIDSSGRPLLDAFPPELVTRKQDQMMKLEMKTIDGGTSTWQIVGSDNIDSLVGSNPIGVVYSEWSLCDPKVYDFIRPILLQNDGWQMFIYTPRGYNHGYTLLEAARKSDKWHTSVHTVNTTRKLNKEGKWVRLVSEEAIDDERAMGTAEEVIQQEYYCSFQANLTGAYYGHIMNQIEENKQITDLLYDPELPLYVAFDLGWNDQTAMIFIQANQHGQFRTLDCYANSGKPLSHYMDVLKQKKDSLGYVYEEYYVPHDVRQKNMETGKSKLEVMQEQYGVYPTVVEKLAVIDGIDAVRRILPKMWFDRNRCHDLVQALKRYQKRFDEKNKVFKDEPVHDWSSDYADAMRMFAVGYSPKHDLEKNPLQQFADCDYNFYNL